LALEPPDRVRHLRPRRLREPRSHAALSRRRHRRGRRRPAGRVSPGGRPPATAAYTAAPIRDRLQLEMHRPAAIYAPTWSPASSLHIAGEEIVRSLVAAGFNVIIKTHDR